MKILRIHYFQHVPYEGLGIIEDWAFKHGHQISATRFYEAFTLPAIDDIDWLIVLGGPMSIHDEDVYPWLKREKAFIKGAIRQKKTVLGICLGAQFVADALGARVYPGPQKEIGWFPVRKTENGNNGSLLASMEDPMTVFHWHGDTFDLPEGAVHLAKSEACLNQAFQYGDRIIGLQFHLEATPECVNNMVAHGGHEIRKGFLFIQNKEEILQEKRFYESNNAVMKTILEDLNAE